MTELEVKVIDDIEYKFGLFMSDQSVKVLVRLIKLVGEPLGKLLKTMGNVPSDKSIADMDTKDFDFDIIGEAVACLANRLDEEMVLRTIKELMTKVLVSSGGQFGSVDKVFNVHFQGKIGHLLKVVGAALGVQYSDFFGTIGGLRKFASLVGTKSDSQTLTDGNGSSLDQ